MTLFDFIYFIGFGVAFIMGLIFMGEGNKNLPEHQQSLGFVIFGAFACASLSWAVPIWWIGFEIYKKLIKQDKLKKENQQLKEQLESDFQKADTRGYELATKFNNTYSENQQLKELLYSLKCCLTSENIEPQIRVEKSLAKIEEFLTDEK